MSYIFSGPQNAEYILTNSGLKPLLALLRHSNTDIVTDTITTLIYLSNNQHIKTEITLPEVVQIMQDLKMSESRNLANLAAIFLQDICGIN